jgi:two-component system phosphate regulon sensor histidine kinase PhoR
MRKRLMRSTLGIIILSAVILTIFFIRIIDNQHTETIKNNLEDNNHFVISILNTNETLDKDIFFKENLIKLKMRVTYIDKNGNVLIDSLADKETMNNHNDRPEVIEARKNSVGYSLRYSNSFKKNMIYVATEFNDGYIVRSSMPVDIVDNLKGNYMQYYIITLVSVVVAAALVSSRISHAIVKPIKDLQYITSQVANGDLDKRIKAYAKDEIGELAISFNNMADKLQVSLKEITEKQNRLEAILKSMDSGVIAIDKNSRVIMINPYAKQIFGIDKDIIGLNLMDIIRHFELENIFKHTSQGYNEIKLYWPKERELRVKTADIINEFETIGTVAVVQDITDIKRLENMRSQFIANVSHELKTPLTSIRGFSETLKYVDEQEQRDKFLDIINDEAERLTRLINDILTLSSIEQHRESKNELIDINEVTQDVFNLMKNTADAKNIELKISNSAMPDIAGDRDKFKQAIINLVDNAIKYSENGDKVSIGTETNNNSCIIWVEDTGVGMSKEHLNRIFERFYRVDKARSRSQGGTGLGLAIVKHIALNFNGSINVESELGKGTKFTLTIPLDKVE